MRGIRDFSDNMAKDVPIQDEEYDELIKNIELDPRSSIEVSSRLKKERKAKLSDIIGELLEKQRSKEANDKKKLYKHYAQENTVIH